MAKYVIDSTTLSDIADSIRAKKGTADAITPEDMPAEIESIETGSGGGTPNIQPLEVTENGTYTAPNGVDGYGPVTVNVPVPSGYIKPSGIFNVTENGAFDITEYATVLVNVATGGGGNFFTTEVTLPSEHAAKSPKVLCTIPYIAEHINDPGLFVMLIRKDTYEMTLSVSVTMACNTAYLNSSYSMSILRSSYGIVGEYKSGAQEAYKLNNAEGTGMNRVYADSAGNIYILPYSSYSFIAGTYTVVYGVL